MDNLASEHTRGVAQYMNTVTNLDPDLKKKGEAALHKMMDTWTETYDLMRTISAKCEAIRLSDKEPAKTIKIIVKGGLVQDVTGMPAEYDYEIVDRDTEKHE